MTGHCTFFSIVYLHLHIIIIIIHYHISTRLQNIFLLAQEFLAWRDCYNYNNYNNNN